MKKLYAFFAAALLAAPTFAQKEVVLVNPNDGKEYTDGQTMIIHPEVDPEWGDVIFEAPLLKNNGTKNATVAIEYTVNYPHGGFQECIGGMCKSRQPGTYTSDNVSVPAGESVTTMTEWNCMDMTTFEYVQGTCTCTFVIYVNGAKGNTVTVKYVYDGTEGIQQTTLNNKQQKAYDLQGRAAVKGAKGIFVQNGKKVIR